MSRIGNKPIKIEEGVTVEISEYEVKVKGPKGENVVRIPRGIEVEQKENELIVTRKRNDKQSTSNHGTIRSVLNNAVKGVKDGFKKELEIVGMGYRANMEGKILVLHLGWSHPIKIDPSDDVTIETPEETRVVVSGVDKNLVGLWASKIRAIKKPEPYKGKGIKYVDEIIRRKTSKTMAEEEEA